MISIHCFLIRSYIRLPKRKRATKLFALVPSPGKKLTCNCPIRFEWPMKVSDPMGATGIRHQNGGQIESPEPLMANRPIIKPYAPPFFYTDMVPGQTGSNWINHFYRDRSVRLITLKLLSSPCLFGLFPDAFHERIQRKEQ